MIKQRAFCLGVICLGVIGFMVMAISPAHAGEKITLNWAHYVPYFPKEVGVGPDTDEYFADELKKRTNGQVEIKIHWGQTLGKTKEMLGLVREGTVDMAGFPTGYFSSTFPLWAAPNSMPFVMTTIDEAQQVGIRLPKEIPGIQEEIKKQNIRLLYHHTLACYQLFSKRPVVKFEDFKGLKCRTWGEQLPMALKSAGGVGVSVMPSEAYEAIKRGVLDATIWPLLMGRLYKHHEVAPNICQWNIMSIVGWGVWMNLDVWNKLPSDVQKIIDEVIEDTMKYERNRALRAQNESNKKLKEAGAKFYDVPESERQKWIKVCPDFLEEWVQDMEKLGKGEAAKQMKKRWLEIVEKY
jgi:TRAP-type C4-dicarboxylate transport system substrate-binding protein